MCTDSKDILHPCSQNACCFRCDASLAKLAADLKQCSDSLGQFNHQGINSNTKLSEKVFSLEQRVRKEQRSFKPVRASFSNPISRVHMDTLRLACSLQVGQLGNEIDKNSTEQTRHVKHVEEGYSITMQNLDSKNRCECSLSSSWFVFGQTAADEMFRICLHPVHSDQISADHWRKRLEPW